MSDKNKFNTPKGRVNVTKVKYTGRHFTDFNQDREDLYFLKNENDDYLFCTGSLEGKKTYGWGKSIDLKIPCNRAVGMTKEKALAQIEFEKQEHPKWKIEMIKAIDEMRKYTDAEIGRTETWQERKGKVLNSKPTILLPGKDF